MRYVLAIDQSTSGTKALLFDEAGKLIKRTDRPHRQIILSNGWVEHDPDEIYDNMLTAVRELTESSGIDKRDILCAGITNQRETAMIWDGNGKPVYNAIVWQCARGEDICASLSSESKRIKDITGLTLSPYFSAAKLAWILNTVKPLGKKLFAGTMDSWLLYKLCGEFKTDYSNAARTQLFDIHKLRWSPEVCGLFGIDPAMLPDVCDSAGDFGASDFGGLFEKPIKIYSVMGDSNSALFAQGCHSIGDTKITYGTGSSVMMNTGDKITRSSGGLSESIAWKRGEEICYVLEGNINYSGAVIKWLVDKLGLAASPKEISKLAESANPDDCTYLLPAFSGLGAPHWRSDVKASITGMTASTGKAEIAGAAEESICFQITDVVNAMKKDVSADIKEIRADGGMVRDEFLMQRQSDFLRANVLTADFEELSGAGAAYMAGIYCGIYTKESLFTNKGGRIYSPVMSDETREKKYNGWKALLRVL